jgi:hypothetical protein
MEKALAGKTALVTVCSRRLPEEIADIVYGLLGGYELQVMLPLLMGGQYDEAGYAALDQIDTCNIERLSLAWSLDLPGEQSLKARAQTARP